MAAGIGTRGCGAGAALIGGLAVRAAWMCGDWASAGVHRTPQKAQKPKAQTFGFKLKSG